MKKMPSDTGVLAAIFQFNQDRKPGPVRLKWRVQMARTNG